MPTIVNTDFMNLMSLIKKIKIKKNFILKESLLNLSYFLRSIFYFLSLNNFNKRYKNIFKYDFKKIILDELRCLRNYNTIVIALNNYFF